LRADPGGKIDEWKIPNKKYGIRNNEYLYIMIRAATWNVELETWNLSPPNRESKTHGLALSVC
jgi:hypothetical protein